MTEEFRGAGLGLLNTSLRILFPRALYCSVNFRVALLSKAMSRAMPVTMACQASSADKPFPLKHSHREIISSSVMFSKGSWSDALGLAFSIVGMFLMAFGLGNTQLSCQDVNYLKYLDSQKKEGSPTAITRQKMSKK